MKQVIFDFGTIDFLGFPLRVYGYGLMLVLGFLTAIYLAKWRARRAGEDPEQVTWVGMLSLVGGILGARIAYVIEQAAKGHWTEFVGDSNPLVAVFNVSSGGLIYYGGLILAALIVIAYLRLKHLPVRRFLDIMSVSLLVGLAFGRAGCLLNGCCYGEECSEQWPLATHFPMYSTPLYKVHSGDKNPFASNGESPSPAYGDQFHAGKLQPDERLCVTQMGLEGRQRILRPPSMMHGQLTSDQLATMLLPIEEAKVAWSHEFGDRDFGAAATVGYDRFRHAAARGGGFFRGFEFWYDAARFADSQDRLDFDAAWGYLQSVRVRLERKFGPLTDTANRSAANAYLQADLYKVAISEHSLALRPAQAISLVNALVLAGILALVYRTRRREGQIFALALILYPVTRFMEEWIRSDNNKTLFSLTHNQYTSAILLIVGIVMMLAIRRMPASCGPALAERQELAKASGPRRA